MKDREPRSFKETIRNVAKNIRQGIEERIEENRIREREGNLSRLNTYTGFPHKEDCVKENGILIDSVLLFRGDTWAVPAVYRFDAVCIDCHVNDDVDNYRTIFNAESDTKGRG